MTDAPTTPRSATNWAAEARRLGLLALLVLGLHSLIAKPFYIPSESMMPGLLVGDRLVVSKYPYGWSSASLSLHLLPALPGRLFGRYPARGDIVILTPPDGGHGGHDLIKRVIGLPGDTVQMIGGRLWLNGVAVATRDLGIRPIPVDAAARCDHAGPGGRICRVHVLRETLPGGARYETLDLGHSAMDDTPPYRVPAGQVFVLGDNRDNSADSRVPVALGGLGGAVPVAAIGGRAEFMTFSLGDGAGWNPLTWWPALRLDRTATALRPDHAD